MTSLTENFLSAGSVVAYPSTAAAKEMLLEISDLKDVEIVPSSKTKLRSILSKRTPSTKKRVGGRG